MNPDPHHCIFLASICPPTFSIGIDEVSLGSEGGSPMDFASQVYIWLSV